jgi:hypothetical protein
MTALVWSPNEASGYPYPGGPYTPRSGDPEFTALDTNRNGQIDNGDDPFMPYWPGDEFVDWIGMSLYHFGESFPFRNNGMC